MQPTVTAARVTVVSTVSKPDGSRAETTLADTGDVRIAQGGPDGRLEVVLEAHIDSSGSVAVLVRDDPGGGLSVAAPLASTSQTNAYGTTVERRVYPAELTVERTIDDDGRLTHVSLSGPWGAHAATLRADGSGEHHWRFAGCGGRRSWDAGGLETGSTYEMTAT